MICKECGHRNQHIRLEPVYRSLDPSYGPIDDTTATEIHARWACERCDRYHFPDGTLYRNPFKDPKSNGSSNL